MSFSTSVELGIEVDSGELRSAKRAIEDELGDVSVGVSSDRARADGGGAGGQSGRRSRRLFRWARQRTQHTEEMVELLTEIEEDLDDSGGLLGGRGDGGGGDGGGTTIIDRIIGGLGFGTGVGGGLGIANAIRSSVSTLFGVTGPSAGATALFSGFFGQPPTRPGQETPVSMGPAEQALMGIGEDIGDALGLPDLGGGPSGRGGDVEFPFMDDFLTGDATSPSWIDEFLNGEVETPTWVLELFRGPGGGGGGGSAFPPGSPNAPGAEFGPPVDADASEQGVRGENGAQRIQIDFEQTLENTQGITPEQAERLVDDKLSEVEREIARSTGRGAGGTRIP